jgi:hypothetical protein
MVIECVCVNYTNVKDVDYIIVKLVLFHKRVIKCQINFIS